MARGYDLPLWQIAQSANMIAAPPQQGQKMLRNFSDTNLDVMYNKAGPMLLEALDDAMFTPQKAAQVDQAAPDFKQMVPPWVNPIGPAAVAGGLSIARAGGARMRDMRRQQMAMAKNAEAEGKAEAVRQNKLKANESLYRRGLIDPETYARNVISLGGDVPENLEIPNAPRATKNIYGPGGKQITVYSDTLEPVMEGGAGPGSALPGATKGTDKVDQEFAKEYNEWGASGGAATAIQRLQDLDRAADALESGANMTGPWIGALPQTARKMTPDGQKAIAVQQDVERVIQNSMKQILGAQFTEKEGQRLLERTFDPQLDESVNAARVRALALSLRQAAEMKEKAARYWEQYGTLRGYEVPSIEAIQQKFLAEADAGISAAGGGAPAQNQNDMEEVIGPDGKRYMVPEGWGR